MSDPPMWARPARASEDVTRVCEARIVGVCRWWANHRHHVLRRSQGGTDKHLIETCWACHEHIHRNPAWAAEHGLLTRREA